MTPRHDWSAALAALLTPQAEDALGAGAVRLYGPLPPDIAAPICRRRRELAAIVALVSVAAIAAMATEVEDTTWPSLPQLHLPTLARPNCLPRVRGRGHGLLLDCLCEWELTGRHGFQ